MTSAPHDKLLFRDEVYAIQGAIFEVYREMGSGFLEAVYQECFSRELRIRGIPFVAQPELKLNYKGEILEQSYQPDFICFGQVLVELKAVRLIAPEHQAQLLNYLKATGLRLGLIVNFGHFPMSRSNGMLVDVLGESGDLNHEIHEIHERGGKEIVTALSNPCRTTEEA